MKRKEQSSKEKWSEAFFATIIGYQEVKSVLGTPGAINYSLAINSPATNLQQVVGHVKPSLGDYVADVEISAKRSLGEEDFKFFTKYFIGMQLEDMPSHARFKEQSQRISEIVGKRFIANSIYPVKKYMQGKVVKVNRGE